MRRALALVALAIASACTDPDVTTSSSPVSSSQVWTAHLDPARSQAALAGAGLEVLAPLPGGRALVSAPVGVSTAARALAADWRPWTAGDRIARELRAPVAPGPLGRVPLMVHVVPGGDADAIADDLAQRGLEVVAVGSAGAWSRISALAAPADVAAATALLADRDDVYFVERIRRVGLFNDKLVGSVQTGVQGHDAAQTPLWTAGLRGEGQIIGVIDTGVDADSCYVDGAALPVTNTWSAGAGYGTAVGSSHRKIIAYDFLYSCDQYPGAAGCDTPSNAASWDSHGHGTHIAGTMLGDSDESPATYAAQDGIAPAAKLVVQDAGYRVDDCADLPGLGCPMIDLTPLYAQAYAQGVRAINNSWGDNENAPAPGQTNYTARTQDVDRFMWEHPDMLIVFAAGNAGGGNREFTVGSPATLKNGLSVGSTRRSPTATSDDSISGFSSRGWTGDGRIKPDLMAAGCNVSAASNRTVGGAGNCGLDSGCGTSYAAPVAVGAAALARQYFVDGRYRGAGFAPSAALVKGVLINSSVTMAGTDNSGQPITPIPSNEQGWGRIQLDRTLALGGFGLFVDDHRAALGQGATDTFRYAFDAAGGRDLKVTLAWTDYPGVPDDAPAAPTVGDPATWTDPQLVNDLDLEVTVDGVRYLGNRFADGRSATGGTSDVRNNVEQVLLPAGRGRVVVSVRARRISVAGQQFALVVTGDFDGGGQCTQPAEAATRVDAADARGVALSWTDPSAVGAYQVERADGGCGGAFSELATAAAAAYVDSTAVPGTTYGYRVRATRIAAGQCTAATWSCVEARIAPSVPDAGVPDAGVPDAAPSVPDATPAPVDAAPTPPDAIDPEPDDPDDGCGCRSSSPAGAGLPLAIGLVALLRRRRRT